MHAGAVARRPAPASSPRSEGRRSRAPSVAPWSIAQKGRGRAPRRPEISPHTSNAAAGPPSPPEPRTPIRSAARLDEAWVRGVAAEDVRVLGRQPRHRDLSAHACTIARVFGIADARVHRWHSVVQSKDKNDARWRDDCPHTNDQRARAASHSMVSNRARFPARPSSSEPSSQGRVVGEHGLHHDTVIVVRHAHGRQGINHEARRVTTHAKRDSLRKVRVGQRRDARRARHVPQVPDCPQVHKMFLSMARQASREHRSCLHKSRQRGRRRR